MCWFARGHNKIYNEVSVAGCLGYDVLDSKSKKQKAEKQFQLLVV